MEICRTSLVNRVYDVWQCVLPDIGSLAMQRMLGRGITINCCKVSCGGEEEVLGEGMKNKSMLWS